MQVVQIMQLHLTQVEAAVVQVVWVVMAVAVNLEPAVLVEQVLSQAHQ
jgi:hypothetical protein